MTRESLQAESLEALERSLAECEGCSLHEGRTKMVFGVGYPSADVMFVGEGPGFHEDQQGEPFVGKAGKLLDELLESIGLDRSQVYIANVVKCRPPGNRDPLPEEIASCREFLVQQIEIISPRVVCTLGNFSTKLLAETKRGISSVHGRVKEVEIAGVPVALFPVFHPAAALYTPANRTVLEEDFGKLKVLLDRGREALTPAGRPEAPSPAEEAQEEGSPEEEGAQEGGSHVEAEQLPLW